jgi:hypothetical protein
MPMRSAGLRVIGVAMLLGLHLFMLHGTEHGLPTGPDDHPAMERRAAVGTTTATAMAATSGVTPVARRLIDQPVDGHDMTAACLAVVAGLVLARAGLGAPRRRCRPVARTPAAPVPFPLTPSPMTFGISRT